MRVCSEWCTGYCSYNSPDVTYVATLFDIETVHGVDHVFDGSAASAGITQLIRSMLYDTNPLRLAVYLVDCNS
jgi:hypothetical protein